MGCQSSAGPGGCVLSVNGATSLGELLACANAFCNSQDRGLGEQPSGKPMQGWMPAQQCPCRGTYESLVDPCCAAWDKLVDQPWTIMSIGLRDWTCKF